MSKVIKLKIEVSSKNKDKLKFFAVYICTFDVYLQYVKKNPETLAPLCRLAYAPVKMTLMTVCSLLLAYLLTICVEEPARKLLRGRQTSRPTAPFKV